MANINITKPTGSVENLNLISAFKVEENTYAVFDSGRLGSMGLPIIFVAKYTTNKLEKIYDDAEWQSVKNYLKGIINGTSFQYIKLDNMVNADEVYYTPLTLPEASFNLIKDRYVVEEKSEVTNEQETTIDNSFSGIINEPQLSEPIYTTPVTPIMPNNDVTSNLEINSSYMDVEAPKPEVEEIVPTKAVPKIEENQKVEMESPAINHDIITSDNEFDSDKETFLKACENMFDALVSKYQKKLNSLELREQELIKKELEIELKLKNAQEHLANAEAREQVANIAHDNAKRVMDISSFMPNNPNDN